MLHFRRKLLRHSLCYSIPWGEDFQRQICLESDVLVVEETQINYTVELSFGPDRLLTKSLNFIYSPEHELRFFEKTEIFK